jgi:hypothetical protein
MVGHEGHPILAGMEPGPVLLSGTRGRPAGHAHAPWAAAIRAGFAAYVSATLVVSLLFGSYWAAQSEFPGHRHPAGSPEHHHSLYQVIGAPVVPAPAGIAENTRVSEYLEPPLWVTRFPRAPIRSTALARGPPSVLRSSGRRRLARGRSPYLLEPRPL